MTPMWKKPLLCSFEATLSPSLVFPEDGLCDISFFQALEQNRTFLKGKGSEYDAALNAYLMNAAKQKKTEHGISLDSKYNVAAMKILKEPIAKKTIKELWGKKIYHWAYLNAEVDDLTAENITHLFEILRATAHKNIRKIAHQELNHTAFYFTATMAARRYIPEKTYAYLAPMQPSVEELFVDIMAYCKNSKYTYGFQGKDVVGSFYVSDEEKKFISFDDSKALGMKFCKGKKDLIDVNYGFIAYNVEMDDPTNKCGKGAYHRVKFLRRLAEFFRDNFTTPDNLKECMKLT
ncbi:hypothetical protein HPB49_008943 [Dermacentor silvarum]|uniref:Uncharacterized protein n=1 Tax=Dermacentor silvarum TaxID=543639 RepID=A0ACB8DPB3_DERSI|nr:hypothetical protein HPB49_008943 [Dermacentor silvarum]